MRLMSGGPGGMVDMSSARSAKNLSKPAGAGKANNLTGAAVAFQWV